MGWENRSGLALATMAPLWVGDSKKLALVVKSGHVSHFS